MLPAPRPAGQYNPLQGLSLRKGDRIYSLEVAQQPVRARMCGFGDKDRRPITPPPCIRLVVRDSKTGNEVDFTEVDSSFFVLTVDLWNENGTAEVNLVRHSSNSPAVSISTATLTPYPPPADRTYFNIVSHATMIQQPYPQHAYGMPHMATIPPHMNMYASTAPVHAGYYANAPATPAAHAGYGYPPTGPHYMPQPAPLPVPQQLPPPPPTTPATGMFTRNLIGSLSVNAFRLNDTEGKVGFWFVLQDLSVRTEGQFRLKMNFVDVGSGNNDNTLNTGKAPVLATTYSEVFQVYSAKKFPGVIESTPLSKAFASQGIKIPIRKDGPKTLSNQAEYDNDEE